MRLKQRLTAHGKQWLWACLLGFIAAGILFNGCRRRTEVETTVGMDSPEQTWIRVLLFGNLRGCTVVSTQGFSVEGAQNGAVAEFDNGTTLRVQALNGRILVGEQVFDEQVRICPRAPFAFTIDGKGYRGDLVLQMRPDGEGLDAINHVPLESYLLGVVGAEMHSYWEPEALKAQAVAARTYCLYIKNRRGQDRQWDVSATQANQVYRGLEAETETVRRAVEATNGEVLICQQDGREEIFCTFYSSSCGGHTENAKNVFGETVGPLSGVDCPFCENIAKQRDFHWKPVTFTIGDINEKLMAKYPSLEKLEAIQSIQVTETGSLDRVTRVKLIGKNGKTDTIRGEDLRLSLDPSGRKLKSTLFQMTCTGHTVTFSSGRGFGHGVGLCQCGAQGMARLGADYRKILNYYFPTSKRVIIKTSHNESI